MPRRDRKRLIGHTMGQACGPCAGGQAYGRRNHRGMSRRQEHKCANSSPYGHKCGRNYTRQRNSEMTKEDLLKKEKEFLQNKLKNIEKELGS